MIKEKAIETLQIEADAVKKLINHIDDEFETIVNAILACNGRVIVTGMGKSGHVGRKIAASLASTGTPSFFMHPAEAFHGDLGMVTANDMVLAISNSGESNEIVNILPIIKRIGAKIIAMSGRRESTLGKNADYYIDISVEREACPLGLAPTASTTATLAMGDALAIALLSSRNFTAQDFAVFHPGGALGRRLLLTVENVMHSGEDNPVISVHKTAKEALFLMTAKGLGATSVVDENGKFIGLVTDGDIRRMLARGAEFLDEPVEDLMTKNPVIITKDKMAAEALSMMEKHQPKPITVLPVIDVEKNEPVGIVHLTDLLVYGGQMIDRQIRALRFGVKVVVGTPGRLIDHIRRNTIKLDHVKMLILDVDGVLTDGSIAVGDNGELFKTFNVRDGLGITLAQKLGIKTAIITGRESKMLAYRARELKINAFYQNKKNKVPAYKELLAEYQLKDEEVAYIGDDLFDLAVMKRVGFPATVADATEEAKSVSILISDFAGGKGAVRQIIEFILKAQEKWQAVIDSYLNIEDETDAKEVEKNISQ